VKAVNLIPSGQRATGGKTPTAPAAKPAPGDSPVGAYAIIAALVFAIGASALFVTTKNDITSKQSELNRVQRQAEAVKQQASALQSFADFKQLADARVATVRGLAASRFPWPSALDDVSRALPEDVYISSLDGTTLSEASGGSSLRGAIQAPSIELNGCTKSQASVARLMAQLREVRGVTRVALAKSEKAETATAAVAPAPATGVDGNTPPVTTQPCPKGAPPAFDMVVFFERAAVNPNATPNEGAAPAGSAQGPTGQSGTAAAGPTGSTGTTSSPSSSTSTTP
jgi:Tfp pilus assembly protein PilN